MGCVICLETQADQAAVRRINTAAFETDAEAKLVDALRAASALSLSLVARLGPEKQIVGHIAFSPVRVRAGEVATSGLGLGPMAVAPSHQGTGIGGQLIAAGIQRLRAAGHRFCVVLGHPEYYPRHGFTQASTLGICWEQPVPDEVFFVQALVPGGLEGVRGVVSYHPAFAAV